MTPIKRTFYYGDIPDRIAILGLPNIDISRKAYVDYMLLKLVVQDANIFWEGGVS